MARFCALLTYDCWALSLLGIWLQVWGNVCTGMKKSLENGHSQRVSSGFRDHCQFFHREYICVRVDHTRAPSLYSRKAACPLEGAGMKKPLALWLKCISSKCIEAFVCCCDMVIKFGACPKDWRAIFALIWKDPVKMSIFHVFSQVASIIASFPTNCAFVAVRASLGILHNILIQLLVQRKLNLQFRSPFVYSSITDFGIFV